jgi:hypothetical protein
VPVCLSVCLPVVGVEVLVFSLRGVVRGEGVADRSRRWLGRVGFIFLVCLYPNGDGLYNRGKEASHPFCIIVTYTIHVQRNHTIFLLLAFVGATNPKLREPSMGVLTDPCSKETREQDPAAADPGIRNEALVDERTAQVSNNEQAHRRQPIPSIKASS